MKDKEIKWVDMMKMIVKACPDLETTNVPVKKWRRSLHHFVTRNKFDYTIMACIILNMVQMAVVYEGSTPVYNQALDYINYFFTTVFFFEAAFKLTAFGASYFKNAWNKFDFFVVISSLIDIVMSFMDANSLKVLKVGP
jgi:hypothetical protein